MGTVKDVILQNLKSNWKAAVENQYFKEPDKVKNADISKNAAEIMSNSLIKAATKRAKITIEDIKKIFVEIRDEVISESQTEKKEK